MAPYDFRSLTSFDFEHLVRDLLQVDLNQTFESFGAGPDQGIDLRLALPNSGSLVVQCKHYVQSGYRSLLASLKKERKKVDLLLPTRYMLATSVSLLPRAKEEIKSLFDPFILSTSDILGAEDLNNLLRLHPTVERDTIKLWMTNSNLLEIFLNSGIYNRTAGALDEIKQTVRLYVVNPSLQRARQVLAAEHVCIIQGIPGIGKTTLAQILLLAMTNDGYEPVVISSDIDEVNRVYRDDRPQAFLYDDFLGQSSLAEALHKNEDSRLLSTIRQIRQSENKRLIMTTRDYILREAQQRHEKISHLNTAIHSCVMRMDDFGKVDRARILYNHIFFSRLSRDTRVALLQDKLYNDIIQHSNFNPRLISHVIQLAEDAQRGPEEFIAHMMSSLQNPGRLWSHVFDNEITNEARTLLLILASLARRALLEPLRAAVDHACRKRLGTGVSIRKFRQILSVLEGTFLTIEVNTKRERFVSFHNPSIRDFLLSYLEHHPEEIAALIETATAFEQCELFWGYAKASDPEPSLRPWLSLTHDRDLKTLGTYVRNFIPSLIKAAVRTFTSSMSEEWFPRSRESQLLLVLEMEKAAPNTLTHGDLVKLSSAVFGRWREGTVDWQRTLQVLALMRERDDLGLEFVNQAEYLKEWLAKQKGDKGVALGFAELYGVLPESFTTEQARKLKSRARSRIKENVTYIADIFGYFSALSYGGAHRLDIEVSEHFPDFLHSRINEINRITSVLNIKVSKETQGMLVRATRFVRDSHDFSRPRYSPGYGASGRSAGAQSDVDDEKALIEAMFRSLGKDGE